MNQRSKNGTNDLPPDSTDVDFNPYAAPASTEEEVGLADDVSFLFSDLCILVRDQVELPKVCILSGSQTELIAVNSEVPCRSRRFNKALLYSTLPCVIFLLAVAASGIKGMSGIMVAGSLLMFAAVVGIIRQRSVQTISVSYWISSQSEEDAWHRAIGYRILAAISVIGMIISAVAGYLVDTNFFAFIPLLGLFILIIAPRCSAQIRPYYFGKHKGLNVLGGFHSGFLAKVQKMVETSDDQIRMG